MFFLLPFRNMLYQIAGVLNQGGSSPASLNPSALLTSAFIYIAFYPLIPRFIIGVRELYDHDIRGHWQGIDSGFGVASRLYAGQDATMSAMVFDVSMDVNLVQQGQGGGV